MPMRKRKMQAPLGTRAFQITPDLIDKDKRTVRLPFSSEVPVRRYDWDIGEYMEILDHAPESVRLDRLNAKAPLQFNHDGNQHIGVVESSSIGADRRGYADARLGRGKQADEKFNDVLDGILVNASFRYAVNKLVFEKEENGLKYYRSFDWTPYEVSLLGEPPADFSIGIGRAADKNQKFDVEVEDPEAEQPPAGKKTEPQTTREEPTMKCLICQKDLVNGVCPDRCAEKAQERTVTQAKDAGATAERQRFKEINELAARCEANNPGLSLAKDAVKFYQDGKSVEEFQRFIVEDKFKAKAIVTPTTKIGLTEKECADYSFLRAIEAQASGDWSKAGFEKRAHEATEQMRHRAAKGFWIPPDVLHAPFRMPMRGVGDVLSSTTPAGGPGSNLIATNLLVGSFIDMYRNVAILPRLGVTVLTDLVGDIAIPKQTGGATMYWIGKDGSITNKSSAEYGAVAFSPKTAGIECHIYRSMLKQSSLDAEGLTRRDMAITMGLGLDLAGIAGGAPGSVNEPTGILYTTGIGAVVIGANGGAIGWDQVVDMETEVSVDNAAVGTLAYVTNPRVRGKLKKTLKFANVAGPIWENAQVPGQGMVNGYRAEVTNQIPSNLIKNAGTDLSSMVFGNWSDFVQCMWGGLDITVDNITLAKQGGLVIYMLQDIDQGVRHAESFCACNEIDTDA